MYLRERSKRQLLNFFTVADWLNPRIVVIFNPKIPCLEFANGKRSYYLNFSGVHFTEKPFGDSNNQNKMRLLLLQ